MLGGGEERSEKRLAQHSVVGLGWLPALTACASAGVVLCTIAFALSRSTVSSPQALFWLGLLAIFAPIVTRLSLSGAGRGERLALVVLLGLSLYIVKIAHDPFGYTFADELAHAPNANAILRTHELFRSNPILPVTAYYPGLESVTAALAAMSGLTVYGAGVIVIGVARLVMMLSLFLLYERVGRSSRVGALAAALYVTNANFLFFSAQFSYESLGLPLMVMVLFAVAEWRDAQAPAAWSVVAAAGTAAVTVTHHMSSYALVVALTAICAASLAARKRERNRIPWRAALFALDCCILWLVFVASATAGYLTPVFTNALSSTIRTLLGESAPRTLFASPSGGPTAPILERTVGTLSVVLLGAALAFGLRTLLRRSRREPFAIVFAVSAIMFFGVLALRFAPAAWETANRSSEFLFIGLGFMVSLTDLERWTPPRARWLGSAVLAGCASVVFAGGVISGWAPTQRLPQPYRVEADGRAIEPIGRELARWAATHLGRRKRFAASDSDARVLATYADEIARFGRAPDIHDVLWTPSLAAWEGQLLRENRLRYVVVDRRRRSFDSMRGYAFGLRLPESRRDELLPAQAAEKFDGVGADRIYDAGNVRVYDLAPTRLWTGSR
jgi:hypothetical protein